MPSRSSRSRSRSHRPRSRSRSHSSRYGHSDRRSRSHSRRRSYSSYSYSDSYSDSYTYSYSDSSSSSYRPRPVVMKQEAPAPVVKPQETVAPSVPLTPNCDVSNSTPKPQPRLSSKTLYSHHNAYATAFFNDVNKHLTDDHRSFVGNDTDKKSMIQHILWVSFWILLLAIGLVVAIETKFIFTILDITTYMFYFFITLEYALLFVSLKIAHYDRSDMPQDPNALTPLAPNRIALLIPVGYGVPGNDAAKHNEILQGKLATLDSTLHGASKTFNPCDIFVIHNSSSPVAVPNDTFRRFCRDRCIYCPLRVGSKSVSAYYASVLCTRLGYDYCIVMDDDTLLQADIHNFLSRDLDKPAYAFAISSTNVNNGNILTSLQDMEYKLSDLNKIFQCRYFNLNGSVLAPHGAINMWRSDVLTKIMLDHNCIFHGEDYVMGSLLRDMGLQCEMVSSVVVPTISPLSVKTLYRQRVTSWDLAAHQFLFGGCCSSSNSGRYIYNLFLLKCSIPNVIHRLYILQDIWCSFQDYIRIPLLVYHIVNSILSHKCDYLVLSMYIVMVVGQLLSGFALEYGKFRNRKDLVLKKYKFLSCLIFPVYRFCLCFARVHAALRYHLRYSAIKRKAKTISEMHLPLPKEGKLEPGKDITITTPDVVKQEKRVTFK